MSERGWKRVRLVGSPNRNDRSQNFVYVSFCSIYAGLSITVNRLWERVKLPHSTILFGADPNDEPAHHQFGKYVYSTTKVP